jgi:hypothetical protein
MSGKRYAEEFKIAAVKQVSHRGHHSMHQLRPTWQQPASHCRATTAPRKAQP